MQVLLAVVTATPAVHVIVVVKAWKAGEETMFADVLPEKLRELLQCETFVVAKQKED